MIDLFDEWTKATDIDVEFIIRKPVRNLARELKKRGYKYHTLYYTNWAQRRPTNDHIERAWYAKQNQKAIEKIKRMIESSKPDLVMTNTMVAPWAALAAHQLSIPHVWFVREYGGTDSGFEFQLGRQKTFEAIGTLSNLVVANSKTLADYLAEYIDTKKITAVYTPFDIKALKDRSSFSATTPFKDTKSLKLIIVGRIATSKGQANVAEAVGLLVKEGLNIELCIVGEPSEPSDMSSLSEVIQRYGIAKKVHLVGRQSNPLAYVAQADIGIMASDKEAFGRTTFEYIALGKPVIGADSGATPEMVAHGRNGYLYELGNPTMLAEAIRTYATEPSLLKLHGEASSKRAETMMGGVYSAQALYRKLKVVMSKGDRTPSSVFDTKWLDADYPPLVPKGQGLGGLARTVYVRTKLLLKQAYISWY